MDYFRVHIVCIVYVAIDDPELRRPAQSGCWERPGTDLPTKRKSIGRERTHSMTDFCDFDPSVSNF
jgi:hypothetical protein